MNRLIQPLIQPRWWVFCVFLITLGWLTNASVYAQEAKPEAKTIKVAVLATRGNTQAIQRWQPTIDWLNQQLPQYQFTLHPKNLEQMEGVIKNSSAEFVITNPGQSVKLVGNIHYLGLLH